MFYRLPYAKFALSALAALSTAAPALAAPKIKAQSFSSAAIDPSFQVCKTLTQCEDILERHDADSFDYAVLASDFDRFGDKARDVLWRQIDGGASGDSEAIILGNRALDILSRFPKILPPAEQRRMVDMWKTQAGTPYRPEFLARLMMTNLSPMVRSTAINTLASGNEDIALASREILAETLRRNMKFQMLPADFVPLKRAVLEDPSPALVALTALYPSATSTPVLTRLLKSGDVPSVIAAYSALYEADPEAAFKALVGTLYGLTPNEAKAAIGLGGLLAHRHPLRDDGFYLKFAQELSQDTEMNETGRAAGFDARLRLRGAKGAERLQDNALNLASYELALTAFKDSPIPSPYFDVPQMMEAKTADVWLTPLRNAASKPSEILSLTEIAGNFDSPLARRIADDALAARGDYRLTIAGILAKTAQSKSGHPALTQQLSALTATHPITAVKAAAALGAEALKNANPRKTIFKLQPDLPRKITKFEAKSNFCNIGAADLRDLARAMPFYDPAKLPRGQSAERAWLTSGVRGKGGWLAGYKSPRSGGLVLYDNKSGTGRELFAASPYGAHSVSAVLPTAPVALGQTAPEFWVFAESLPSGQPSIFRARQAADGTITISRNVILPAPPSGFNIQKNGEVKFAMSAANPPLILSSNGALARACSR